MPTVRRAITRSRSRARTRINRLSLAFTVEFRISRSPNILSRVTPWQAIGGKTSTADAPGRGFWRICIRELNGPRQHDIFDGINLHLWLMDLRGRRRWQALRPSPRRFRSSSGLFHFGDNDRSACQKIYAARDVQSNSDFATSRI